ncbi:MAG: PIN domain-containing protein [Verrucomicrobiota bacterium]
MHLIDTSIWIEFFPSKGDPVIKATVADLIKTADASYSCPIRFELIAGARSHEVNDILEGLSFTQRYHIQSAHWNLAASSAATLRSKGETVPASDILIATIADAVNLTLLARDEHFKLIQKHSLKDLRIVAL